METESVSVVSGPHDMEIEEALKYSRKSCVSFVQFTNTICCWVGVTEPHDMEDIEKISAIIFYKHIYAKLINDGP